MEGMNSGSCHEDSNIETHFSDTLDTTASENIATSYVDRLKGIVSSVLNYFRK